MAIRGWIAWCGWLALAMLAPGASQAAPPNAAAGEAAPARFPLQVSDDRRYLADADDQPFLVVGDTAWSLIAQLPAADIDQYLDDRQHKGFSAIIVNLIEHKFADRAPALIDGTPPFLKPGDFTRPNPKYFDFAYSAIAAANRRGISVWLCPAYLGWGGGDEGFFREIKAAGPQALRGYGRYIGERFRDLPNIVWMVGGDYALPRSERWTGQELALGIREGGARQIMTAHGGQSSAVATFGEQAWLAVDNVYRYDLDLWRALRNANASRPSRPFLLIESAYEGEHKASAAQIRRQAWWSMTCGACGQFFGNNPIWYFDGPGFTDQRSADSWQQALDLAGSRDMARLGRCFRALPWQRLVPDLKDKLITAGAGGSEDRATAARTPDGKLVVLYIPSDGRAKRELTLDLTSCTGPLAAQWFNPAKDEPPLGFEKLLANRAGQIVTTPGDNGTGANDWLLVLEVTR